MSGWTDAMDHVQRRLHNTREDMDPCARHALDQLWTEHRDLREQLRDLQRRQVRITVILVAFATSAGYGIDKVLGVLSGG